MTRVIWAGMLVGALALAGCGVAPGAASQAAPAVAQPTADAMMAHDATPEAMMEPTADAMMAHDATPEAMMEPTADAMMAHDATPEAMMEPTADAMMAHDATPEAMMEPTADAMAMADWLSIPLTDARTGATFTLADFHGRTVYVEPMATWCPKCRAQLGAVQEAAASLKGQEGAPVFVALSVETDLPPAQLAQYAADNGFEMVFAVATPELLGALVETFGRTITNPPSTPHFVVAPDGSHGELMTGASTAAEVLGLVGAGGEG